MPVPFIVGMIQAAATVGIGLYKNHQTGVMREEAREIADTVRSDTLRQQKISNDMTQQKQTLDRQGLANSKEIASMTAETREDIKSEALLDNRRSILKTGRDKQAQSSLLGLQDRSTKKRGV